VSERRVAAIAVVYLDRGTDVAVVAPRLLQAAASVIGELALRLRRGLRLRGDASHPEHEGGRWRDLA
jgi:hypothetical protein